MINIILLIVIAIFCVLIFKNSKKAKQQAIANAQIESDYLIANAKVEGVQETASGLQYKIIHKGDSENTPSPTSMVKVHYHGTLIDGTVFDSSYDRGEPTEFPVGGVIAGWTEALQMMTVGSKWRLTVPYELAYGEQGAGGVIGPFATLIFDIELLDIVS